MSEQAPPGRSEPTGWSDRVRFSRAGGGIAYRPDEVLSSGLDGARELLSRLGAETEVLERVGPLDRLRATKPVEVPLLVAELRAQGFVAQPNHVFFADCGGGCGCPPHPSAPCGPGANPVYASPVYASPVYASPVYASPVYASPVYASPVYASPVYASDHQATGLRRSSARPVSGTATHDVIARISSATGGGPRVAVLDTGLAVKDLRPASFGACITCVAGTDDDEPDRNPTPVPDQQLDPAAGHGTFIAGLIVQVAPTAQVQVHRVLSGLGDGDETTIARVIAGLAGKVDILNLSFSGYTLDQPHLLASAIRSVQLAGGIVVASAGNDGGCRPTFPAALPDVVSVGAVGPAGPAPFSNHGPWVRACAPGVDLVSGFFDEFDGTNAPGPDGIDPDHYTGYARWSGTSFSAPLVAGALARELADGSTPAAAVARLIDGPHLFRIPGLGTVVNVA